MKGFEGKNAVLRNFFFKICPTIHCNAYIFYNANFFLSLITVLSPTFCSLAILLKDFSIYLSSKMTFLYFIR